MRNTKALATIAILFVLSAGAAERHAKNVILFLGDAGGIPTLNAASIYQYEAPQKLFIQHMPQIALSDTSSANNWVTDSAAGMTAIVTGQKANNGVLSSSAVRGQSGGTPLKTILEYAEEHGLSTGVISNMPMADATPAACYAHANERRSFAEIFAQILNPRFGDGVDLVIGGGRKKILEATEAAGMHIQDDLKKHGYAWYDSPDAIPATAPRVVALFDEKFEVAPVVKRAIEALSRNPKGFFLMVEWDMHTNEVKDGLDHVIQMDGVVRQTAQQVKDDTLILFTADHSFDLRLLDLKRGKPILAEKEPGQKKPNLAVGDSHTGEEVLVAAQGPGSERVHGFLANTDLFRIMLAAYGWPESAGNTGPASEGR